MDLSKSRKSKNVDDIRKQKPKVRTAANVAFPLSEKDQNKVRINPDFSVTGKMQESKKKSSFAKMNKPLAKMGLKAGVNQMSGAKERDALSRAAAKNNESIKAMESLFKPLQLNDSIFPKPLKGKK
jgi:hypothetical protein